MVTRVFLLMLGIIPDTLPVPPSSVTVEVVSETKVLVAWQPQPQTGDELLSFRVFYQQTTSSVYRSVSLMERSRCCSFKNSGTVYLFRWMCTKYLLKICLMIFGLCLYGVVQHWTSISPAVHSV